MNSPGRGSPRIGSLVGAAVGVTVGAAVGVAIGMVVGVAIGFAAAAPIQNPTVLEGDIHFWEDGGFPPREAGDLLNACGLIEVASAPLLLDFAEHEYTFHISDAVSFGQFEDVENSLIIFYSGGSLDVWADAYAGPDFTVAEYGVDPPNATAPSTFSDGVRYLHGEIGTASINYNTVTGSGILTLQCFLVLEPSLGVLENPEAFLAGNISGASGSVLPGYDLFLHSGLELDHTLPLESITWDEVKSLYR